MPRRYLIIWLLGVLSGLFLVVSANGFVDPYGLLGAPRIVGFNAKKPAAANRSRVVKPYQVTRLNPSVLIVGNSRPEMGLDPEHPCITAIGPTYSLTLPGAGLYQQVRYAQHALSVSNPKLILLGLDFLDFLVDPESVGDPHRWPAENTRFESRLTVDALGKPNPRYWLSRLQDYRDALMSLTALKDSVYTLVAQDWPLATDRTERGFNPANDYLSIIANEGQNVLFAQKNAEVSRTLGKREWAIFRKGYRWSEEFEAVARMLHMAEEQGADVIGFINPYHAQYLERIREAGYRPLFDQWKAEIAKLVTEEHGVPLWDFARVNELTSEQPPSKGDTRTVLKWFWEPAHYRKELGELMLVEMLGRYGCLRRPETPEIGERLGMVNESYINKRGPGPRGLARPQQDPL